LITCESFSSSAVEKLSGADEYSSTPVLKTGMPLIER
jgi:hypothetical protein